MKVQSCEMMSHRGDVHILIRNYALYEGIKPLRIFLGNKYISHICGMCMYLLLVVEGDIGKLLPPRPVHRVGESRVIGGELAPVG